MLARITRNHFWNECKKCILVSSQRQRIYLFLYFIWYIDKGLHRCSKVWSLQILGSVSVFKDKIASTWTIKKKKKNLLSPKDIKKKSTQQLCRFQIAAGICPHAWGRVWSFHMYLFNVWFLLRPRLLTGN